MYLKVLETGDYMLLAIADDCTLDECFEQWEEIVKRTGDATGEGGYRSYFEKLKSYAKLVNDFNQIKINLTVLYFQIDIDCLVYLRKKGYKINTSSNEKYLQSLNDAMHRSDNIISKILSKHKEIQKAVGERKGSNKQMGFEEMMAHLKMNLEMQVSDDVTLARYNEYYKIIKAKQAKQKQTNGRGIRNK
jgi:hypothetical protein